MAIPKPPLDRPTRHHRHFHCAWCERTMRAVSVASAPEVNYGMCRTCLDGELQRLTKREDSASSIPVRPSREDRVVWTAAV